MTREKAVTYGLVLQFMTVIIGSLCGWLMLICYNKMEDIGKKLEAHGLFMQEMYAQQLALKTRMDYHEKATQ